MSMRAKDPDKRSRLLRAAATSAFLAGSLGAFVLFCIYLSHREATGPARWDQALFISATLIMVAFWITFLVLYVATVRKSRSTLEFERYARLEEQRKTARTREALRSGGAPGDQPTGRAR